MSTRNVGGELNRTLETAELFNDIPENKAASPKQMYAASGKMASLQGLNTGKVWYAMFKTDSSSKTKKLTHGDIAKILSASKLEDVDTKYLNRFNAFTKDRQAAASALSKLRVSVLGVNVNFSQTSPSLKGKKVSRRPSLAVST